MIIIFTVILVVFFFLLGSRLRNMLEEYMISNANTLIRTTVLEEKRLIDSHFRDIEKIGETSAEYFETLVKDALTREEDPLFNKKYKMKDGAIRTNPAASDKKDISGVFVSSLANLSSSDRKIISAMELYFSSYSKGMSKSLLDNYFISKNQFIRIYPPKWAMEVESDHDFTKDIFFSTADPENNPSRRQVWTPVYYDSIWKQWMTSLLVPIYVRDEFIGIIGNDLILNSIYKTILGKKYYSSGYGFIFDSNENIIIHQKYMTTLQSSGKTMGQRFTLFKIDDKTMGKNIKSAADALKRGNLRNRGVFFTKIKVNGEKYFFHACRLDFMDWNYGIMLPESAVLENVQKFKAQYFNSVLGFAILFLLAVILVIWHYVIAPVTEIFKAAQRLGKADFDYRIPYHSRDEISDLAIVLNNAAANLKTLTASKDTLNKQIEERIKTEEELEKFKAASDGANCGIAILTADGAFAYINDYYANIHGYSKNEATGTNMKNFHSHDQMKSVNRLIKKLEAGESVTSEEIWHKHKDGKNFPMLMSWYKIKETRGGTDLMAATAIEISAWKNAEQRRIELERVINLSNAIVFVWENEQGWPIKYVSENVKNILGYSSELFYSGQLKFFDIICEEDLPTVSTPIPNSGKYPKFLSRQYRIRKKSGDFIWVDDRILVRRNRAGKITLLEGITIDITDRKKTEELDRQKSVAENANKAKSEFIANMSHEIRTPMNAILGFTEIVLASAGISEENKTALGVVKDSGDALLRIINDILDISKIEAGKMEIVPYPFSLRQSMGMSLKSFELSCRNNGLEFISKIPPDIPDLLLGDSIRLRQVLVNLVGNAAKFTARGGIYVNVSAENNDGENIDIRFEVKDTGIGIPPDKKEIIFEAFMQADSSTTRQYGGTGLGLAICARIIKMMGGRIWVESEMEKGSNFFFTVPFKICTENIEDAHTFPSATEIEDSGQKEKTDISDIRIMLAEDNFGNQELIKMIFSLNAVNNFKVVNNGIEAIEAFSREKFDIVLMDIHMPGMNGFEACQKIREMNRATGKQCIIIALTASTGEDERRKCMEGGMDDYLSKPITEKDLIEKIEAWCNASVGFLNSK